MLHRRLVPGLLAISLSLAGLQAASLPQLPGVHNFHQVNEHVYRGAQPTDEGFAGLAKIGVRTIVDLRGEKSEGRVVEQNGMHYVRMRWSGFKAPAESQIAAVLALLNDKSDWPVFVHCKRGADRTGTAIACYRVEHDHWTNEQALAEAKSYGMSSMEVAMQHFIMHFSAPALASVPTPTAVVLTPIASPAQ